MNYYLVLCKCGHVSRDFYMPIEFCVRATDGKEAAKIARTIPRVKRNHKDAILRVMKVSKEVYDFQNEINDNDPYLLCKSKHEQKQIFELIKERLVREKNIKRRNLTEFNNSKPNLIMQAKKYMLDSKFYYI